ncbi:helicase associated domain-containing protein [Streptomyces sp. NPDC048337]|uniref:helicase associated domain-containing protein n=1 Tax=Streptomyces sp. NPDC048337 TaxID=3365535 RepID=UPI003714FD83
MSHPGEAGIPDTPGRKPARRGAVHTGQLAAIDEDWNPSTLGWTVDWQRHYAYLAQLLADGARLAAIVPGVTRHGEDIGRWLDSQRRQDWERLNEEQQRRLDALGVKKAVRARTRTAKAPLTSTSGRAAAAFQTGIQALQQFLQRQGPDAGMPRRGHIEQLPDGSSHRTGIWIANQKQRRDRLHPEQLSVLAELGVEWAR